MFLITLLSNKLSLPLSEIVPSFANIVYDNTTFSAKSCLKFDENAISYSIDAGIWSTISIGGGGGGIIELACNENCKFIVPRLKLLVSSTI